MPEPATDELLDDELLEDDPEDEDSAASASTGNGNGHAKRHPRAFARRLAIAFGAVAVITVALAGVLMSVIWNYQFEQYVKENLVFAANDIAQIIETAYPRTQFTYETLSQIVLLDPAGRFGVQVLDAKGTIVYDQASMRQHMMQAMLNTTDPRNPSVQAPKILLQPAGQVVTSPIIVNGKRVGTVRVWVQGTQALLSDRDLQFRRGALIGLAIAALFAVLAAALLGLIYAGIMVRPIERITATAQALRNGEKDARTNLSTDDEIGFLGKTFDEMADSIEADREMERRLTADVAHELRTPLQAIQATVEAMQDGVLPADAERLGIVRDETRRLSRLTNGILELTRLERGNLLFDVRRMDAASSVSAAVDSLAPLVETCELTISSHIAEGIFVNADGDRLQQAVGNLLSNAARYTPAGGHVDVSLRRNSGSAVIEVTDTGIGIAEEDLPRVFARFWRADDARATTTGGLGIGLAVTREIVERLGGKISAGPRADGGQGTTFTIRLPLA